MSNIFVCQVQPSGLISWHSVLLEIVSAREVSVSPTNGGEKAGFVINEDFNGMIIHHQFTFFDVETIAVYSQ